MKKLIFLTSLLLMVCFVSMNAQTDKQKEAAEKAEKAAQKAAEKEAAKEAARQAKYAEKAAEEEAKIAAKEAEKAAKKAEKEAEKMAKKAEKEAEKATKKIEKEADKMAKKAEKEAEKAAKKVEKEADKMAKKAEKEAEKAAEKAEKAAVKKAEKEEKARQKEIMKGKEKELKMEEKAAAKAEKKAKKAAEKAAEAKEGVDAVTGATSVPTTEKAGYELKKPAMESDVDSLAYMFGVAQSNGLMNYLQNQLGVDSACLDDFCKGVMERAEIDQSDKKQYAYFQGLQIGGQIENMAKNFSMQYYGQEGKSVDTSIVASGVLAGLLGKAEMPVEGANAEFQKRMNAHKEEMNTKAKAEGDAKQKAFLDENRQKDGVKETASGLQYKVITAGNGPVPTATDKVKVHYEGHLIDGTEFDSSYQRGEPATFAANQVIKGWTEALCMMPVGSKWELYIPYDLAYGERAAGKIPPYSTLIFTVELLSIEQ